MPKRMKRLVLIHTALVKLRATQCAACCKEMVRFEEQNKMPHSTYQYHDPADYCVICDHIRSGSHN